VDSVKAELYVMLKCDHTNIVRLLRSFQDRDNLHSVTDLAPHGDLQKVLEQAPVESSGEMTERGSRVPGDA
jgi:serine/threonine protein kinase